MSEYRFKVGQMVDFSPGRAGVPASSREYKILRCLPVEGGNVKYQIKSATEAFERIAKESDLAQRP